MGVPAEAPATAWVRRPRGGANAKWSGTCCVPGGGGGGRGSAPWRQIHRARAWAPARCPWRSRSEGTPPGASTRRGRRVPTSGGRGWEGTRHPRAGAVSVKQGPRARRPRRPPARLPLCRGRRLRSSPRRAALSVEGCGGRAAGRVREREAGETRRAGGGSAAMPSCPALRFPLPPPPPPQVLRPSRHTHTSHAGLLSHDVSTAPGTQQQGVVGIQHTGLCSSGPPRRHSRTRQPPASTAARRLADGVGRVGWGARSPDARGAASEGETSQRALACAVRSPPCWGQCARAAPAPRLGDARVQRGHTASSAAGAERSRGPARRQASHPRTLSRPWPHRARRGRMGHIHGGRRDRSLSPPMTSVIDG